MLYIAPTVVRYGSVAGLTATGLKCTPGIDTVASSDTAENFYELDANGEIWENKDGDGNVLDSFSNDSIPNSCVDADSRF